MRYLLIDANHLAARCWAVNKELVTSKGAYSGGVYGVLVGINYVHRKLGIDYPEMIACWDGGRSEFRKTLYPGYKDRAPTDPTEEEIKMREEYINQINVLHTGLTFTGCRQVHVRGVEADDIIGVLSSVFTQADDEVIVYSGDKDMHQLISDKVTIWDPKKEHLFAEDILKYWNLDNIEKLAYYRAIVGDTSDVIEGIRGLGPVRAQIVMKHLNLNDPFTFDSSIPLKEKKWTDKFVEHRDIIERNLKLMSLPRDPMQSELYSLDQWYEVLQQANTRPPENLDAFIHFLREWEIYSILDNLNRW